MKCVTISRDFFRGALSVETSGDAVKPWRIDYKQKLLFPSNEEDALLSRTSMCSGVRLCFYTTSKTIKLTVKLGKKVWDELPIIFDLVIDNELVERIEKSDSDRGVEFKNLKEGDKKVALFLPQTTSCEIESLEIDDDATFLPWENNELKWITYGSSITHCVAAAGPSEIWPAIVGKKHNLNYTALGFGGECHCDSMFAQTIRDLPADVITLKLGINIYGHNSMNSRAFKPAIIGFIKTIREKHPTTPIGVISPIVSPSRENAKNKVDFTLVDMRREVEDAVRRIVEVDHDEKLLYFNGLDYFGEESAHYLYDGLHPDAEGTIVLGERIANNVLPKLLEIR